MEEKKDKKGKGISRRDFLLTTGLCLTSGKLIYDSLINLYKKEQINRIFNELPNYVYLAEYSGGDEDGNIRTSKGYGIVLDRKYISVSHIIDMVGKFFLPTPFGLLEKKIDIKNKKCMVKGKELEILVEDIPNDVFIADVSCYDKDTFADFPCKPTTKRKLGDTVYMIGNPQLKGTNIRKGIISDLDTFGDDRLTKNCFGIDIGAIGGDSGTPCVNEDFELLGLVRSSVGNVLGYVIGIEHFLKKLDYLNNKKYEP